jgi:hypothetical protein
MLYGREPKGAIWRPATLKRILTSEAALGYLMHKDKPVLGADGRPIRIADPLWDQTTRAALIKKTARDQVTRATWSQATQAHTGQPFGVMPGRAQQR